MADITVADMTVELLTRFDNFLHKWENEREPGKLLHPNTIEVQFNILRTLVHRAIEVGIMEASKNPFLVFKYKGVKTVKEKLDDSEKERIINLELEEGSLIWHCKNYFCSAIIAPESVPLTSYSFGGETLRITDAYIIKWVRITKTETSYLSIRRWIYFGIIIERMRKLQIISFRCSRMMPNTPDMSRKPTKTE